MKKHIASRNSGFAALTAFVLSSSAIAIPASAQSVEDPQVRIAPSAPLEGMPTFQVNIEKGHTYDLSITDSKGFILYTETVYDDRYGKRFQIDIPGNGVQLFLKLDAPRGGRSLTYSINTPAAPVRDVVVSRL